MGLTGEDLKQLRIIHCTCDDDSLCSCYKADGLSEECRENCPGFCKMWDELEKRAGLGDFLRMHDKATKGVSS